MGAQLVLGDDELPVPAADPAAGNAVVVRGPLRPMDNQIAREITVPNPLVRRLAQRPELADALKDDIARALSEPADQAFLAGIRADPGVLQPGGAADLAGVRGIVMALRANPRARFRSPGWVLPPGTLDVLAPLADAAGRSLDSTPLLESDGEDGGLLLGYPFVVSAAAGGTIFFASDWSEAWVAAGSDLVRVDVSSAAHFAAGETGVRAVLQHDFVLREPGCFAVTDV
jgi:HK97 family phage major capsid protein